MNYGRGKRMKKKNTRPFLLSFALIQGALWACINSGWAGRSTPPSHIASGTTVTPENWQAYRQFMSEGLVALFEGRHFWHVPPDLRIEVGPTISIPLPGKYREDTAKYSNQVKLTRIASGGYVPTGYVAGIPFPDPLDGDPAL